MRSSQLDEIGDKNAPVGSRPYIVYYEGRAEQYRDRLDNDVESLRSVLGKLEAAAAWKERGSMSWGHYVAERFRLDGDDLAAIRSAKPGESLRSTLRTAAVAKAAQPLAKHGVNQHSEGRDNITSTPKERGTSATYLAAKLKRDHPAIAADMEAGRYRSVRAAAKAAGIVRDATPFERVLKLLAKLDEAELRAVATEANRLAEAKL